MAATVRNIFSWTKLMTTWNSQCCWNRTLELLCVMHQAGVTPDKITLLTALKAANELKKLAMGKLIDRILGECGLRCDADVGKSLLNMYNRHGSLEDSRLAFERIQHRDVIAWTMMISAYAQRGHVREALQVFQQMRAANVVPNKITFLTILTGCTTGGSSSSVQLEAGMVLHKSIRELGLEDDVAVGTSLMNVYGKCGSVEDAKAIFDKITERDALVWNSMMSLYCQHEHFSEAIEVFQAMMQAGLPPDAIVFSTILTACATPENLRMGVAVHAYAVESGYEMHTDLAVSLVNMYAKCNSMEDACRIFHKASKENEALWNVLLAAYSHDDKPEEAFQVFRAMLLEGVTLDKVTFVTALNSCFKPESLLQGNIFFSYASEAGLSTDVAVANAALNMYSKCVSLVEARNTFDRMQSRDTVSWNIMIAAYGDSEGVEDSGKEAVNVFRRMQLEGEVADDVTFVSILKACADLQVVEAGKQIHSLAIESGYEEHLAVGNALVNFYGKCGSLDETVEMFSKMKLQRVVAWTAIVSSHALHGHLKEGLRLFQMVLLEGFFPDKVTFITALSICGDLPNLIESRRVHAQVIEAGMEQDNQVANAVITMYSKCGNLQDAHDTFENMIVRNLISWNTMLASYAQNGHSHEVLKLFGRMQQHGVKPDRLTFISVLSACSHDGLIEKAFEIYVLIPKEYGLIWAAEHHGCIIDLLGRLGRLDEAEEFMNKLHMSAHPRSVWTTLLGACQVHGALDRGQRVAERAFHRDPTNCSPYVALSNIYSGAGRGDDAAKLVERKRLRTENAP